MRTVKYVLIAAVLQLSISCGNFYGDIDLGGGYVYLVQSKFNSINFATNKKNIYASSYLAIARVDSLGYDKSNVLVISSNGSGNSYWWIDKTKEGIETGFIDGAVSTSNMVEIDSVNFQGLKRELKIDVKSKHYYRKESGNE